MRISNAKTVVGGSNNQIEYVYDQYFESKEAAKELTTNGHLPPAHGAYQKLTKSQERDLFLRFNYAKYRASKVSSRRSIDKWMRRSSYWKEIIAWHNTLLAIHASKPYDKLGLEFDEIVAEAQFALNSAIEKFDVNRGFRFSTYAMNAMKRRIWRALQLYNRRSCLELVPELEAYHPKSDEAISNAENKLDIEHIVLDNRALSGRERYILASRYGLNGPSKDLRELGDELGLSSERIRQIQNHAIKKLRKQFGSSGKIEPKRRRLKSSRKRTYSVPRGFKIYG